MLLVTLFVIPSRLVFAPLGGAGSPPQILGMVLFVVWLMRRKAWVRTPATGLHWAMLAFATAVMISYAQAALRPIVPIELSSADRGVLAIVGWSGLFLTVADGLTTRAELDVFLRRVVTGGGFVALVGLLQFVTKQELTDRIFVPGLSNTSLLQLGNRNGFTRPQGTAIHPIEFGAVLTMILPLAIHFAMHDQHRSLARRWLPVAAIAVAVPISISRSAIISVVVILLAVVPTFAKSARRRAYLAIVGVSGFVYVLVPGLLGTILGLFTGISGDSSTASRTDSYALADQFIERNPVFGRGFRTFGTNYRILDNQYLGLLIEVGVVGLLTVLALFVTAMVSCRKVRHGSSDESTRSLAQALFAAVASTVVSIAVYDAFSFPMATNTLFLLLGAVAALVRVSRRRIIDEQGALTAAPYH